MFSSIVADAATRLIGRPASITLLVGCGR